MKLKIALIALAFLLPVMFVRAEDGLAPCFDYYKFGSVQVDISPVNKDTLAGTDLVFNGNVRNTNSYPIVHGSVYVKIFRKDAKSNTQANGWELVDQFFAKKDINIDGKKQSPISFTWKVPAYSVTGEYKVATYFVTQDRFNLSGLSFTDDITGTIIPFKVSSEQTKGVRFDRESVKVNGQKFMFAAFTPKVGMENIKVSFDLKNDTLQSKNAEITYTLYSWDGLRNEKIINTKKEVVNMAAGSKKSFSYDVTDIAHPVYYLVIESKVDGAKSIMDIRFVRQGVEEARLNFPGVDSYPLKQGTEATMFSCFHNSGLGDSIQNGKVVLSLIDSNGKKIDTYTYEGEITGRMMAIKKSFIPTKNYGRMTLVADLYVGDKHIETSRSYYECEKLNQEVCIAEAYTGIGHTSKVMTYVVIILALFVLLVAIFAYHGHMKRKDVGVAALLFVSTLGMGMFQVNAKLAAADILDEVQSSPNLEYPANSVQGQYIYNSDSDEDVLSMEAGDDLGYVSNTTKIYVKKPGKVGRNVTVAENGSVGYIRIDDLIFQYTYGAEMRNATTDAIIPSGQVIPVGTKIKFVPVPFSNNHAAWFLSGATLDSPYAYWDEGTGIPQCNISDKFATQRIQNGAFRYTDPDSNGNRFFISYQVKPTFDINVSAYLPIVITKPNVSITLDPSTTATTVANSDGSFTVTGPGTVVGNVKFSATTGKAYFQYKIQNLLNKVFEPMYSNNKFVDFKPGQESKLAEVPFTAEGCQKFIDYEFPLEEKVITFDVDVDGPINKPPYAPGLTLSGTCINSPTNILISPANPKDPNVGDTITYDYQVDYGTGYGSTQNTANTGTSVTFTTTGQKKIRVRARDNGNLTSAWVEKIIYMTDCAQLQVRCSDPIILSNNKPQWTADVTTGTSNYSVAWSLPSVPGSASGPNNTTFTADYNLTPGSRIQGPIATASITGFSASTQCPAADRTSGGGGDGALSGQCIIDDFDSNIPTWKATINNGRSPYTRTWYNNGVLIPGQNTNSYTYPRAVLPGETISGISSTIVASNGTVGPISCPEVKVTNTEKLILSLKGANGVKVSYIRVKQNQPVSSSIEFNGVTNSCTYSPHLTSKLINPSLDGAAGPSQLADHSIDTSMTGVFDFNLTCRRASDNSLLPSNNVRLSVVADSKLEEI